MGQGCTSCSVGNPCTDPSCTRLGSGVLRKLVDDVKDKYEDHQEQVRDDERNETWLKEMDNTFIETNSLTQDAFKHHANNVRNYLSKAQPTIDDLESVEYRLMSCLDSHKTCEYLECTNSARDLGDLASHGRDQPAHCKAKPNPYSCTYEAPEKATETKGSFNGSKGSFFSKTSKDQPFGSCYA